MVSSAAKRARRKKLAHERQDRELARQTRQMDPGRLDRSGGRTGGRGGPICTQGTKHRTDASDASKRPGCLRLCERGHSKYDKNTKRGNSRTI